jgi:hypothetical protein
MNYRAIARGFLVDMSTTCLFAATLSVFLIDPGSSSISMAERLYATDVIDWLCLVGGLTMTALGGFVAGRMAPCRELTHATAVGCLSLMAAFLTSAGTCPFSDWYTFTGLVMSVPVAQLGGALAGLYNNRHGGSPS